MKNLIAAVTIACAFAGAANATTYSVDVTAATQVTYPGVQSVASVLNPGGPQLFTGATESVTLDNVGDTVITTPFGLVAYERVLDAEDLTPRPIFTSFDIAGVGIVNIVGSIVSNATFTAVEATFGSGSVAVDAFTRILVSIADVVFATDGTQLVDGRAGLARVTVTYSLVPVPVPATLPLVVLGLAGLGFAARRRKSANV